MGTITYQVPTAGQQNSTEDPKVATALTTLLTLLNGNVDTNNLAAGAGIVLTQLASGVARMVPVLTSASVAVADGQRIIQQSTSKTVTLPAVAAGATVGVVNVGGTPVAPTTIAGAGGALIYGMGTTPAASIVLGQPYASAMLQCDGTNWAIIAGQQDTGWVALSLGGGVSSTGGYTPAARLRGDTVTLCGTLSDAGGTFTWGTVPAGLRPTGTVTFGLPFAPSATVSAAGALTSSIGSTLFGLDGLNYRIA